MTEQHGRAFAAFRLTNPHFGLKGCLYLESRAIGDRAALAILHFAAIDDIANVARDGVPVEIAAVTELLAGLAVPDAGPGDEARVTATP